MSIAATIEALAVLVDARSRHNIQTVWVAEMLGDGRPTPFVIRTPTPKFPPEPIANPPSGTDDLEPPAVDTPPLIAPNPPEPAPTSQSTPQWEPQAVPLTDDEPWSGFHDTTVTVEEVAPGTGGMHDAASLQPGGHLPPQQQPIVVGRRARPILTALATRSHISRRPDVVAARESIARAEPLTSLAMQQCRHLARPIVAIIDRSAAMTAFAADGRSLECDIRSVDSSARCYTFTRDPRPLLSRIPPAAIIFAFTDLGIGQPLGAPSARRWGPLGWRTFAAEVGAQGGTIVALVPYPMRQIAEELCRQDVRQLDAGRPETGRGTAADSQFLGSRMHNGAITAVSWHEGISVRATRRSTRRGSR